VPEQWWSTFKHRLLQVLRRLLIKTRSYPASTPRPRENRTPGGAAHGDAQEQFEDTAHANATIRCVAAGRRGALNSYRGIRVRVGAIFDVRALLMPPLALSA
jgi:hypothetical protein